MNPLSLLKHHVTGAIERGESVAIVGIPATPAPLRAVCRIERATKRPIIIYKDNDGLTCYTREEQHSEMHPGYHRNQTRLANTFEESSACARLMMHYESRALQYDNQSIIWGKRL